MVGKTDSKLSPIRMSKSSDASSKKSDTGWSISEHAQDNVSREILDGK